nr:MAG TPA: hypothetical protein [Siphoviridae sp. ctDlU28]
MHDYRLWSFSSTMSSVLLNTPKAIILCKYIN